MWIKTVFLWTKFMRWLHIIGKQSVSICFLTNEVPWTIRIVKNRIPLLIISKAPKQKVITICAPRITIGIPTIQFNLHIIRWASENLSNWKCVVSSDTGVVMFVHWQIQTFSKFPENIKDETVVKIGNNIWENGTFC